MSVVCGFFLHVWSQAACACMCASSLCFAFTVKVKVTHKDEAHIHAHTFKHAFTIKATHTMKDTHTHSNMSLLNCIIAKKIFRVLIRIRSTSTFPSDLVT